MFLHGFRRFTLLEASQFELTFACERRARTVQFVNMPRTSLKKRHIGELYTVLRRRLLSRFHRTVLDDDDSLEDAKDSALASVIREAESRRHLFRSPICRKGKDRFTQDPDLNDGDDEEDENIEVEAASLPWLNDEEFLQKCRMSRECFGFVLDLIKDHFVFKKIEGKSGRSQTPVVNQLMVFLKCVGMEGSGANGPNQHNTFDIGKGTSGLFCRRVIKAICALRDRFLFWPDEQERKVLARLTYEEFGFPHCVGIADGTLFPLAFEPDSEDAPDYSGRKHGYSLTVMIICDLNKKIRYYLASYPGSAHDNRVYDATSFQWNTSLETVPLPTVRSWCRPSRRVPMKTCLMNANSSTTSCQR